MEGTHTLIQRTCQRGFCQRRFCCMLYLWKHAQCTGQSMSGWIVCVSPGLFLCSTGGQSVRVSSMSDTQLFDHCRSPQMCSSAVLLGAVLVILRSSCVCASSCPPHSCFFLLLRKNFAAPGGLVCGSFVRSHTFYF